MKTWQEVKESANYGRLRNSVEMRVAKHSVALYGGILAFSLMMVAAPILMTEDAAMAALGITVILLALIPFPLFYIHRIFKIYSHIDDYTFTEVVLDKPHGGFNRMIYFSVTVKDRFGASIPVDTHEIFYTHGWEPLLEDYVNKKVLIGYNNVTQYVVVIG